MHHRTNTASEHAWPDMNHPLEQLSADGRLTTSVLHRLDTNTAEQHRYPVYNPTLGLIGRADVAEVLGATGDNAPVTARRMAAETWRRLMASVVMWQGDNTHAPALMIDDTCRLNGDTVDALMRHIQERLADADNDGQRTSYIQKRLAGVVCPGAGVAMIDTWQAVVDRRRQQLRAAQITRL